MNIVFLITFNYILVHLITFYACISFINLMHVYGYCFTKHVTSAVVNISNILLGVRHSIVDWSNASGN